MVCTNCSQEIPEGNAYCPNCGASFTSPDSGKPPTGDGSSIFVKIIALILFVVIGIPAALAGACFVLVSSQTFPRFDLATVPFTAFGILLVYVSYLLLRFLQKA